MTYSDVWSSVDGINWVQEHAEAPWSPRGDMGTAVFNGRLWVMGGSVTNDVWSYGLHVRQDSLPDGTAGSPYVSSLEAKEGDAPFLCELIGGTVPPGLTLDVSVTGTTAPITGTPSAMGDYSFTVRVTDNNGYNTEQPIQLRIKAAKPLSSSGNGGSGCALSARPVMAGPGGLGRWRVLGAIAIPLLPLANLRRRRA